MTTCLASLHATLHAAATPRGFRSRDSRALTGARLPARAPRGTTHSAVMSTTRASIAWSLDGPGCAGARSGQTLVGYGRLPSFGKNNAVPAGPPRRCPLRPVAISDLCDSHLGRFKMLNAVFEQEGDVLYVRNADSAKDTHRSAAGDAVGTHHPDATRPEGNLALGLARAVFVRLRSFLVAAREASADRRAATISKTVRPDFPWTTRMVDLARAVSASSGGGDGASALSDEVLKKHVGVRDSMEVRFVRGVPRFSQTVSRIEESSKTSRERFSLRRDEGEARDGETDVFSSDFTVLTVDGRPVRGRAALKPGAIVQIGGMEYEVLRDVIGVHA